MTETFEQQIEETIATMPDSWDLIIQPQRHLFELHLDDLSRYLPWKPGDIKPGLTGYGLAPIMVMLKIGFSISSIFFHQLEKQVKFIEKGYPKNYVVLASKTQ